MEDYIQEIEKWVKSLSTYAVSDYPWIFQEIISCFNEMLCDLASQASDEVVSQRFLDAMIAI